MGKQTPLVNAVYVRNRQHVQRVDLSDLLYIRAEGNYCYLHGRSGELHTIKWSLRQLMERLPNDIFLRIHKSFVVNMLHIKSLDMKTRELQIDNQTLPIGRTYISTLTDKLLII